MANDDSHGVRIFILMLRQDDPHRCTAARLTKFGLARPLHRIRQIPRGSLVLNPMASLIILPRDRSVSRNPKLVAIDCSWEKVKIEFGRQMPGLARRLPTLLAANPTNYAKQHKLSSAEALAAASYILGFREMATKLLSMFKWGHTFLTLNEELLKAYSLADSEKELSEIESQFF